MTLRRALLVFILYVVLVPSLSFAIVPQEESSEEGLARLEAMIFSRELSSPELDAQPSLVTIRQATAQSRSELRVLGGPLVEREIMIVAAADHDLRVAPVAHALAQLVQEE